MGSILLVESDPDTCDRWSTALGAAGHAVVAAFAMREALPVIREGGIDVVIIDAYQVNHGIVELARSIQALPDAPPFILVSSSPDAPELSARIGASTFLAKPCETADLLEAVGGLLGRMRPVRTFEDEPTAPATRFSTEL